MRTVAHISDLHFGREDRKIAEGLLLDLKAHAPSLIVVSGDLTQRAKHDEFIAAKNYFDRFSHPSLIVPGNHDIPLYNVVNRFIRPLDRYKRYITDNLNPTFVDEEIAVVGINTARSLTLKNGAISFDQLRHIEAKFHTFSSNLFKVLVVHHQFVPPPDNSAPALIRRAADVVRRIELCGVNLVLAGHTHKSYTADLKQHYQTGHSILVAHAGTAISKRGRGEPNGYNLISLDKSHVHISMRTWDGHSFVEAQSTSYHKIQSHWHKEHDRARLGYSPDSGNYSPV